MSWHWKDWLSAGTTRLWDKATDLGHELTGIPTADERRNQAKDVSDQVNAYKAQTELTRNELAAKANEVDAAKRQVEEKQIRALRGNYRGQSLLGDQSNNQNGMSDKLGG